MAEQVTGTVEETGASGTAVAYDTAHMAHNPGRPISWVGTSITVVGFALGGIAFPVSDPGPNWVLFWIGAAIAIVGCFVLLFSKAMSTDWY